MLVLIVFIENFDDFYDRLVLGTGDSKLFNKLYLL